MLTYSVQVRYIGDTNLCYKIKLLFSNRKIYWNLILSLCIHTKWADFEAEKSCNIFYFKCQWHFILPPWSFEVVYSFQIRFLIAIPFSQLNSENYSILRQRMSLPVQKDLRSGNSNVQFIFLCNKKFFLPVMKALPLKGKKTQPSSDFMSI